MPLILDSNCVVGDGMVDGERREEVEKGRRAVGWSGEGGVLE